MNDSKAEGTFDQVKGKIKQGIGETFNDQSLANEGAADQVKGHAKETWGSVKDTAHDLTHSNSATAERTDAKLEAEHDAHATRNSVTGAFEHAKDSIQHGLDHLTHKAND